MSETGTAQIRGQTSEKHGVVEAQQVRATMIYTIWQQPASRTSAINLIANERGLSHEQAREKLEACLRTLNGLDG